VLKAQNTSKKTFNYQGNVKNCSTKRQLDLHIYLSSLEAITAAFWIGTVFSWTEIHGYVLQSQSRCRNLKKQRPKRGLRLCFGRWANVLIRQGYWYRKWQPNGYTLEKDDNLETWVTWRLIMTTWMMKMTTQRTIIIHRKTTTRWRTTKTRRTRTSSRTWKTTRSSVGELFDQLISSGSDLLVLVLVSWVPVPVPIHWYRTGTIQFSQFWKVLVPVPYFSQKYGLV